MAVYAIGDVQGCHRTLERLVARLGLAPADRVWLVGDLVNRGPASLEVLRWARAQGERLVAVLGNHDLHLLARGFGARPARPRDTLDEVLAAPDRDVLLDWLRQRPLLHFEPGFAMMHAGLHPSWTWVRAAELAAEVEAGLRGADPATLFRELAAGPAPVWREGLDAAERRRASVEAFTRIRTLRRDGSPCRGFSGAPYQAPRGCGAWFDLPSVRDTSRTLVCGHWAALGFVRRPGLIALDTGCVWGRTLTAVRLDDGEVFQEPCADV